MDFIAGTPIDEHCDHERLTVKQRLELFLTVCSAVQYAHQNFVVHRDIKPQNILVTSEGAIRLLDFGIAKLLDPDAEDPSDTIGVVQMMTPEYASPEQLLGQPVAAASDTWSLGVLLYVLLTGHKPFIFKSRSIPEICDVIRNTEPRRPSCVIALDETTSSGRVLTEAVVSSARRIKTGKLARELDGDLDNILLMALRREPERRYGSVEQLAGDIQNYLDGRPVTARQDTAAYRAAKFMQRHQGAVIAASFAVFTLIAASAATAWEARLALRERARADRRFNDVRRVANSLLFDVHDAIRDLPGSAAARKLIADNAVEFLNSLARDSDDDPALRRELAAAWERVGDIQQSGERKIALASYKQALAMREALATANPRDPDYQRDLLANYGKLSDLLWSAGDSGAAMTYSRKLLAASETIAASPSAVREDRIRLAASYLDLGYKLGIAAGDAEGALPSSRKALAMFTGLQKEDPADRRVRRLRGVAGDRLAEVLEHSPNGRDEALRVRVESLAVAQTLLREDPANAQYQADVALGEAGLASGYFTLHRFAEALPLYREAVPALDRLVDRGQLPSERSELPGTARREMAECELAQKAQAR
jgi:non-specific serine/threonine protein kinase/serine/threonine-protein kinase